MPADMTLAGDARPVRPGSLAAFTLVLPMTLLVLAGVVLVVLCYRQVVSVYTRAGGSYVVARRTSARGSPRYEFSVKTIALSTKRYPQFACQYLAVSLIVYRA
jgi:hypothetical protein